MRAIKSNKPLSDIEQNVADYLQTLNIQYSAHYVGATTHNGGDKPWEGDSWLVEFSSTDANQVRNGYPVKVKTESFAYFTGSGHRVTDKRLGTLAQLTLVLSFGARNTVTVVIVRKRLILTALAAIMQKSCALFSHANNCKPCKICCKIID